jgi:hypothetical protein
VLTHEKGYYPDLIEGYLLTNANMQGAQLRFLSFETFQRICYTLLADAYIQHIAIMDETSAKVYNMAYQ